MTTKSHKKKKNRRGTPPANSRVKRDPVIMTSIDTITMDKFIACQVDRDYSVLVVKGTSSQKKLVKAWDHIFSEYCGALEDERFNYILELTREIESRTARLESIRAAIACLRLMYDDECIAFLVDEGYSISGEDLRSIQDDLNRAEIEAANESIDLELLRQEFQEYSTESNTVTITRNYFTEQFTAIESGLGLRYSIEPERTTVRKYCAWILMLRRKVERQTKPKINSDGTE